MFTQIHQLSKRNLTYTDVWQELRHNRKLVTLEAENSPIELLGPIPLPRLIGNQEIVFRCYFFRRQINLNYLTSLATETQATELESWQQPLVNQLAVNSLLIYGDFESSESPLVRVHSNCTTGDIFGSMRCDCGQQLKAAFSQIVDRGVGAVVYMAGHEGRGIGLWAKGAAYLLQDRGLDTYCANRELNFPDDCREFADAAVVLQHFVKPGAGICLLTNNPTKRQALDKFGVKVLGQLSLPSAINKHNQRYLLAKMEYGHTFGWL